jgi:hypothetical protein
MSHVQRISVRLVLAGVMLVGAGAHAANFGSKLNRAANVGWGCESMPTYDTFTNAGTLQPSGQTTCTLRSGGWINRLRRGSQVPGDGRITRIQVRAGANPAPMRLTILQSSIRKYPNGESDYSCCTARFLGKVFRPAANARTTRNVNVRVSRDRDPDEDVEYFDEVALSVMGPGTLPLFDDGSGGQLRDGAPITAFSYPFMRRGQTRVDAIPADGLELLFRWTFRSE